MGLLEKLRRLERIHQTSERTITLRRSYAPNSEIQPTPEQLRKAEELCERVRREHPHAVLIVHWGPEGEVTVTPTSRMSTLGAKGASNFL